MILFSHEQVRLGSFQVEEKVAEWAVVVAAVALWSVDIIIIVIVIVIVLIIIISCTSSISSTSTSTSTRTSTMVLGENIDGTILPSYIMLISNGAYERKKHILQTPPLKKCISLLMTPIHPYLIKSNTKHFHFSNLRINTINTITKEAEQY